MSKKWPRLRYMGTGKPQFHVLWKWGHTRRIEEQNLQSCIQKRAQKKKSKCHNSNDLAPPPQKKKYEQWIEPSQFSNSTPKQKKSFVLLSIGKSLTWEPLIVERKYNKFQDLLLGPFEIKSERNGTYTMSSVAWPGH